ncbi:cyclopropane-fatty-acyl-phospholipid synthase [Martensiomyces pterosporus]|nr:cyclopropane-fatty-acyl-phospholipid synthase [Martensiomyces pterosporus]
MCKLYFRVEYSQSPEDIATKHRNGCSFAVAVKNWEDVAGGSRVLDVFIAAIESGLGALNRAFLHSSDSYLVPAVKQAMTKSLANASVGSLTIEENGESNTFGNTSDSSGPHVRLVVLSKQFWVRLVFAQDLGFAEAYMAGEILVSDLVDFVKFYVCNRSVLDTATSSPVVNTLIYLANTRFGNSVLNAASNISAHYDLGNEMFEMFLDPTMCYSSALWKHPNETLEQAQLNKLDMLIDKAHLKSTDYVLDIGCGWGALCMRAVGRTGCRMVGITLSAEQKELAEHRISQAGMSDRITVLLADYRDLDPAEYCFDKIISVEMVEHVGHEYYPTYFAQCDQLLHPNHGVLVVVSIVINEERYEDYRYSVDFIKKHIFPGGHLPSTATLVAAAAKGSKGRLMLEGAANFPDHYARTLRIWRERFLQGYDKVLADATPKNRQLIAQVRDLDRPDSSNLVSGAGSGTEQSGDAFLSKTGLSTMSECGYNSIFKRKWEYYFAYCEAAFATRAIGVTQLVFTRAYNRELTDPRVVWQEHARKDA